MPPAPPARWREHPPTPRRATCSNTTLAQVLEFSRALWRAMWRALSAAVAMDQDRLLVVQPDEIGLKPLGPVRQGRLLSESPTSKCLPTTLEGKIPANPSYIPDGLTRRRTWSGFAPRIAAEPRYDLPGGLVHRACSAQPAGGRRDALAAGAQRGPAHTGEPSPCRVPHARVIRVSGITTGTTSSLPTCPELNFVEVFYLSP